MFQSCGSLVLFKYLGQYFESIGNGDGALKYYQKSKDFASVVRMLCLAKRFDQVCLFVSKLSLVFLFLVKAEKLIGETKDRNGAFQLGRFYERLKKIPEAIKMYKISNKYYFAIQLAKNNNMDDQIFNIAMEAPLKSRNDVKKEAAK